MSTEALWQSPTYLLLSVKRHIAHHMSKSYPAFDDTLPTVPYFIIIACLAESRMPPTFLIKAWTEELDASFLCLAEQSSAAGH